MFVYSRDNLLVARSFTFISAGSGKVACFKDPERALSPGYIAVILGLY